MRIVFYRFAAKSIEHLDDKGAAMWLHAELRKSGFVFTHDLAPARLLDVVNALAPPWGFSKSPYSDPPPRYEIEQQQQENAS